MGDLINGFIEKYWSSPKENLKLPFVWHLQKRKKS